MHLHRINYFTTKSCLSFHYELCNLFVRNFSECGFRWDIGAMHDQVSEWSSDRTMIWQIGPSTSTLLARFTLASHMVAAATAGRSALQVRRQIVGVSLVLNATRCVARSFHYLMYSQLQEVWCAFRFSSSRLIKGLRNRRLSSALTYPILSGFIYRLPGCRFVLVRVATGVSYSSRLASPR